MVTLNRQYLAQATATKERCASQLHDLKTANVTRIGEIPRQYDGKIKTLVQQQRAITEHAEGDVSVRIREAPIRMADELNAKLNAAQDRAAEELDSFGTQFCTKVEKLRRVMVLTCRKVRLKWSWSRR
jgi:hypothetical protein